MKLFFKVLPLLLAQSVFGATVNKIYPQWAVSNSTFNFTIEGTGFGNGTTFDFGGVDCDNDSRVYASSTKITYKVTCYPSTAGKIALLRINHNGTQVGSSSFQFFAGNPIVSDISVNGILNAGNTVSFDITGSYLPKTLAFAFTDCHDPQASGGISSSQRTFTCTYWGTAKQGTAEVKTDKQDNGGYVIKPKTFSTNQTVQPSPPISQDNERPYVSGLSMVSSLALGKKSQLQGTVTDNQGLDYVQIIVDDPDNITTGNHSFSRSGSKIFDLSNFTFDPTSYTGQKTGKYRITVGGRDLSGNQAINYTLDVNVYKEVVNNPNQSKIDALQKQKEEIAQEKLADSTSLNNASNQSNNNLIDVNKKKSVYNNALEEQKKVNSAISEQTPSFDVIPNDAQVVPKGCLLGQGNKVACLLTGESESIFKTHQSIYIEYNQVTNQTYPALIYGVGSYLDTPASCTQEDVKPQAGNTTRCQIKERVPVNTPVYMVGNAKHLEYVYKHFQANKGSWAFRIDNKFQDELDSIAAARQETNFSLFNIDAEIDNFADSVATALPELVPTQEEIDNLQLIVQDVALGSLPYIGNGKAIVESISGHGLIINEELSTTNRVLNVTFIVFPPIKILTLPQKLAKTKLAGKAKKTVDTVLRNGKRGRALEKYYAANPEKISALLKGKKCFTDKYNNSVTIKRRFLDLICDGDRILVEVKLGGARGKRALEQLQQDIAILEDAIKKGKDKKIIWTSSRSEDTGVYDFGNDIKEAVNDAIAKNPALKDRLLLEPKDILVQLDNYMTP